MARFISVVVLGVVWVRGLVAPLGATKILGLGCQIRAVRQSKIYLSFL